MRHIDIVEALYGAYYDYRTTERELIENWEEEKMFEELDPFEVDDKVWYEGSELKGKHIAHIKECCGVNFDGHFEYYIEFKDAAKKAVYATENEIKLWLPEAPKRNFAKNACDHPNKYNNVISKALSFWVCPDCGKEV